MKQRRALFVLLALVALIAATWSFVAMNFPAQKSLDQRVHEVSEQLKCPVCQGESVADSNVSIAQQMRANIRQQLQAGKSEQEVLQYFADRYGDEIVWTPRANGFALFAWLVPLLLLLAGGILIGLTVRDWLPSRKLEHKTKTSSHIERQDEQVDADLERYRARLEQELAEEDALFRRYGTEAR